MNEPLLKISELSSLNFRHDWRLHFQSPEPYIQTLLPTDHVCIQYSTIGLYTGRLGIYLTDEYGNDIQALSEYIIGSSGEVAIHMVNWPQTRLSPGAYMVQFRMAQYNRVMAYATFRIVDELEDSVLFTYTNYRDDFGTVFEDIEIDFRVEAVWLPSEASFMVNAESFRDQNGYVHQLSANPYETRVLTLGGGVNACGVPNWVARKVNNILSCSSVFIDGAQYVRSEGATPERTDIAADYPLFLYKITLEPQETYFMKPLPEAWLLTTEDGRLVVTEDGKAIDVYYK